MEESNMSANTSPIFIGSPLSGTANTQISHVLATADSTDIKDVVNGATNGTVIQDLIAVSDDTDPIELAIYLYDGANSRQIGQVNVPAGAGTDAAKPSVSLLNTTSIPSLDKRDDGAILLASGQKLQVAATVAVTADKAITIVALGGNL